MKTQTIQKIKCGPSFAVKKLAQANRMISFMAKKHPDITAVYDAMEPIQITLSDPDVKTGVAKDRNKCAFATAACRLFKSDDAYVGIQMACLKFGNKLIRFNIPESVSREIVCFDRYKNCDPSKEYRFSAVTPHRRLSRIQEEPKHHNGKIKKARKGKFIPRHWTKDIRKSAMKE